MSSYNDFIEAYNNLQQTGSVNDYVVMCSPEGGEFYLQCCEYFGVTPTEEMINGKPVTIIPEIVLSKIAEALMDVNNEGL